MVRCSSLLTVLLVGVLEFTLVQPVRAADAPLAESLGLPSPADFPGGLIVNLGCGDGRLTGQLAAPGNALVHGLDTDAARVQAARLHLQQSGLYGRVSVDTFDGRHLPYADNLVNWLVVRGPVSVERTELVRVLRPGGIAMFTSDDGQRMTDSFAKPFPQNTDEWTHFLYDASGNPVAHDEVVGPPGRVQWIAGPRYMRSHEHVPGIYGVVSSGGRIFYIQDEAETGALRAPPQWSLVARDAFNGTLLWKQPIAQWFPHFVGWGSTPRQLQHKLVAVNNRVYVTLGLVAPLTAVDAVTGQIVRTYDDTRGAEEVILHDGVLLGLVRSVTDERMAELEQWEQWAKSLGLQQPALDKRDSVERLVRQLKAAEATGRKSVLAWDAESGRTLWRKGPAEMEGYRELSLRAAGDRVLYQQGQRVVCVDLRSGDEHWSAAATNLRLIHGERVICADNNAIEAFSLASGDKQWSQKPLLVSVLDAFVAGGSLWIGGFKPFDTGRQHTGPAWGPYFAVQHDLQTGQVLKQVEPDNPGHHHRCYSNKATDRYILGGRRGTEFIDLDSGEVLWNSWVRGVCKYGVLPCNGLLYAPPHACGCYTLVKTTGFFALAPRNPADAALPESVAPPQRGPAYEAPLSDSASPAADAWPAYRHDGSRSGSTEMTLPAVAPDRLAGPGRRAAERPDRGRTTGVRRRRGRPSAVRARCHIRPRGLAIHHGRPHRFAADHFPRPGLVWRSRRIRVQRQHGRRNAGLASPGGSGRPARSGRRPTGIRFPVPRQRVAAGRRDLRDGRSVLLPGQRNRPLPNRSAGGNAAVADPDLQSGHADRPAAGAVRRQHHARLAQRHPVRRCRSCVSAGVGFRWPAADPAGRQSPSLCPDRDARRRLVASLLLDLRHESVAGHRLQRACQGPGLRPAARIRRPGGLRLRPGERPLVEPVGGRPVPPVCDAAEGRRAGLERPGARASPGDAADRQPVVPCRRRPRAANGRACRGNRTRECCWPSRRPMAVCRASWPSTGPPSSMAWRPRRGGCSWLRKVAKSSVWKASERTRRRNEETGHARHK